MPDPSQAEKDLALRKQTRTTKLRAEFNKLISNPHRQATMEGGHVFDHGMQRFQAMSVNHFDHFRPSWKSFKWGFFGCVLPIVVYAYFLKTERDGREHLFRTGQVAYKDRQFKFI